MRHMQGRTRRSSDAGDALTIANSGKAPGKSPATARLRTPGGAVQARAQADAPEPQQQKNQDDAGRISTQDIMYEIIAHRIGYQDTIGSVEGDLLKQWGYEPHWASQINDAATGFFVGVIKPDADHPDLAPILVFRGTEGGRDLISDLHPHSVGYNQFRQNKRFVQQLISEAGGRVDVTGHSLGGALAQHCAAAFTSNINRVVTFQSPGIDASAAQRFNDRDDRPQVTHHIAGGDLVDTAGEQHLDGEVFRHTPGGGPLSHTKFLLSTPEYQAQREQLGLTDEVLGKLEIDKETNRKPVERHERYPHPVKNAVNETVRSGVGMILYPVLNGVSVLTRNDDKALREQIAAADEATLSGHPISERSYMVDRLRRGITGNADEDAILKVLRASAQAGDVVQVIDLVGPHLIARNVHGKQYKSLRSLYQAHYYTQCSQDQAFSLIQRCIKGLTSEWEEQMIADILVARSDGRALITRVGGGSFADGLNTIQWQLDGGDQRRVDAEYDR